MPVFQNLQDIKTGETFSIYSGGRDLPIEEFEKAMNAYQASSPFKGPGMRVNKPMSYGGLLVLPHSGASPEESMRGAFEEAVQPVRNVMNPIAEGIGSGVGKAAGTIASPFFSPQTSQSIQQHVGDVVTDVAKAPYDTPEGMLSTGVGVAAAPFGLAASVAGAAGSYIVPKMFEPGLMQTEGVFPTLLKGTLIGYATKLFNAFGNSMHQRLASFRESSLKNEGLAGFNNLVRIAGTTPEVFRENPEAFLAQFRQVNGIVNKAGMEEFFNKFTAQAEKTYGKDVAGRAAVAFQKVNDAFDKLTALHPLGDQAEKQTLLQGIKENISSTARLISNSPIQGATPRSVNTAAVLANDPQMKGVLVDRLKRIPQFANLPTDIGPAELERILSMPLSGLDIPRKPATSIIDAASRNIANDPRALKGAPTAATRNPTGGANPPQLWEGLVQNHAEWTGPIGRAQLDASKQMLSNAETLAEMKKMSLDNMVTNIQEMFSRNMDSKMLEAVLDKVAKGQNIDKAMQEVGLAFQQARGNLEELTREIYLKNVGEVTRNPLRGTNINDTFGKAIGDAVDKSRGRIAGTVAKVGVAAARTFRPLEPAKYPGAGAINPGVIELIKREFSGKNTPEKAK